MNKFNISIKAFTSKSNLNSHLEIHTGVKQYKCNICEKAFTRKSDLNSHLEIHNDVKQYNCGKFVEKLSLKGQAFIII